MDSGIPLRNMSPSFRSIVGGKAWRLARMLDAGVNVPDGIVVPTSVYKQYVSETRIDDTISMELARRKETGMRWEEMWDASLRIRNLFLRTPLTEDLHSSLADLCERHFGSDLVCVRSSAPGEDEGGSSFAGLHSSFVGISGAEEILKHIRLVWASLWSDGALLYRNEIGLDIKEASMAVVIQEFREGDVSGVVFSQDPSGADRMVCEAVPGLNEGLVDGTVAPDRWFLSRGEGSVLEHQRGNRQEMVVITDSGTARAALDHCESESPLLNKASLGLIHRSALELEALMKHPQDIEWTLSKSGLSILQSRNVTTAKGDVEEGSKAWQLTLRRSFENLRQLQRRIEDEVMPSIQKEYEAFKSRPLGALSDHELAQEYRTRQAAKERWRSVYWKDCIPMAHGMRLFGEVYNDMLMPEDPHEFVSLLAGEKLDAIERNQEFARCSDAADIREMARDYGAGFLMTVADTTLSDFAHRLAESGREKTQLNREVLEQAYFESFTKDQIEFATELLDLARASYRLRDNDNVALGRLDVAVSDVVTEAERRIAQGGKSKDLHGIQDEAHTAAQESSANDSGDATVRQVTGQPSGPGIAVGKAHVIRSKTDILSTQPGDIIVCDAIDPTMTIAVPLCAGIVERRGGMLIHGAIIAREYGLPCVTGIDDAVNVIHEGANLTVDGYLGIVRIDA